MLLSQVQFADSYAPMSHKDSFSSGRRTPRWSVVMPSTEQALDGILSLAGLPKRRARVWVEPSLSRSLESTCKFAAVIPTRSVECL